MSKHQTKPRTIERDLEAALRRAEPFARNLVMVSGIHPSEAVGDLAPDDAAQQLAGVALQWDTDEDERFQGVLRIVEHAYVLGIAVGLKLRGIGGAQ